MNSKGASINWSTFVGSRESGITSSTSASTDLLIPPFLVQALDDTQIFEYMLVCNWGNISGSQNGSLPISEHLLNVVCLKCAVNMCGTTSTRNLRLRNAGKRTHERASRKTRGGDSQPRHCLVWRACIVFTFTCAHSESCDYPVAALYLCVGSCSSKSNRLFVRTLRNVIWIAVERQVDECLSRISLRKRRTNCTRHILRI